MAYSPVCDALLFEPKTGRVVPLIVALCFSHARYVVRPDPRLADFGSDEQRAATSST